MKLSDYVMEFVARCGVRHVFLVPGGGAMHLNDSLARSTELEAVSNLHEQAAGTAAQGYAKARNDLGVALLTTGPGATNAVTPVAGAFLDSTPMLFLSGQVKRADLCSKRGVRSYGVQEVDIIAIVQSITKYAVLVTDPKRIRYELEKAHHLATTGRPGPVWIDIPLDVQGAEIDPSALEGFSAEAVAHSDLREQVGKVLALLRTAVRPVVLMGNGVRCAHAEQLMERAVELIGAPVLLTWLSIDLLPANHPLYVGRPGLLAPRGANFTLQNSDVLLAIGARLDLVVSGYAPEKLARAAKKIVVDVDPAELEKTPVALPILADARVFLEELVRQLEEEPRHDHGAWLARAREWNRQYPLVLPEHRDASQISIYAFTEALDATRGDELVVSGGAGSAVEIFLLVHEIKPNETLVGPSGLGAMGFGLAAATGACLARDRKPTILVKGDGGLQFNVQELETIRRLGLPIKMFIMSNDGYASIRMSQKRHFGRLLGADPSSGLTLPPLDKLAAAYGLPYTRMEDPKRMREQLAAVLGAEGPQLCEVVLIPDEERAPALAAIRRPDGSMFSPPLEDLSPPLSREELRANMLIDIVEG